VSDTFATWAKQQKPERRKTPPRSLEEKTALRRLRQEASANGATLADEGEGKLPPSTALGVMRRDGYRCTTCQSAEELRLKHKTPPLPKSKVALLRKRDRKVRDNNPENLTTICVPCRDKEDDDVG